MSVIIKSMKIPENCFECPLAGKNFGGPDYCGILDEFTPVNYSTGTRPEWCPLEEVKEEKE